MSNSISGDFFTTAINGADVTGQIENVNYNHDHTSIAIMPGNVGVHQFHPGLFKPKMTLNGYVKRSQTTPTAHGVLYPEADTEMIVLVALGENATPVAGNYCIAMDGTVLPDYTRTDDKAGLQKFQAPLQSRGVRLPAFPVLLMDASQKDSLTTTVIDDGAEGVGTTNGGASILEVLTPTGIQATGTIGKAATPSDGNHYDIGIGAATYTYTFKTALTSPAVAGEVKIGTTNADTYNNLFMALIGDPSGSGVNYGVGTVPLPATLLYVSVPVACVITLTAIITGVAANSYTLACTGANLAVSGALMSGGLAGETATIVVQTATSAGGAYTTVATHTLDMTKRAAEIIAVPVGTTIDRYIKVVVTMSAGTMTCAARLAFGRWYAGQL